MNRPSPGGSRNNTRADIRASAVRAETWALRRARARMVAATFSSTSTRSPPTVEFDLDGVDNPPEVDAVHSFGHAPQRIGEAATDPGLVESSIQFGVDRILVLLGHRTQADVERIADSEHIGDGRQNVGKGVFERGLPLAKTVIDIDAREEDGGDDPDEGTENPSPQKPDTGEQHHRGQVHHHQFADLDPQTGAIEALGRVLTGVGPDDPLQATQQGIAKRFDHRRLPAADGRADTGGHRAGTAPVQDQERHHHHRDAKAPGTNPEHQLAVGGDHRATPGPGSKIDWSTWMLYLAILSNLRGRTPVARRLS